MMGRDGEEEPVRAKRARGRGFRASVLVSVETDILIKKRTKESIVNKTRLGRWH
jgi:hypothetical protein